MAAAIPAAPTQPTPTPAPTPMAAPPAGGPALTPDDLDGLTDRWSRAWGDRIPSTSRLGVRHGDPGVTLRLLPVGRDYPATDEQWWQVMSGYGEVLTLLAAGVTGTLLLTHGWQQHGAGGSPGRDAHLATLTPSAIHWRTDDFAREPGFTSLVHSYVQRLPAVQAALPVVELFAADGTDDVLIVDDEVRWTAVLRNGGLDVLTTDRMLLARVADLTRAYPEWSG